MSGYVIVGGCVAPAQQAPFLVRLQKETGCVYDSIYRGDDARDLLHSLGKHTQAEIYWEYEHGLEPNPANPPGQSTHELRSDGVAYAGPVGRVLEWWQCGIDIDDGHVIAFTAAAHRDGYVVFGPYHSGSEYHHRNFERMPKLPRVVYPFLPIKYHAYTNRLEGHWIYILSQRLQNCGYLADRTSKYSTEMVTAIKQFQTHHHLTVDGVTGVQTWVNIKKAETWCLAHHRKEV